MKDSGHYQVMQKISLSIVSHGQGALIEPLLQDCRTFKGAEFEIILTLNIPEDQGYIDRNRDLGIKVTENRKPKGFGANHNSAFQISSGDVFVVVNPDIRACELDFSNLRSIIQKKGVGACAPVVMNAEGITEDSARRFPTIFGLLGRKFANRKQPDYDLTGTAPVGVDWVAGMFVAFPRTAYESVNGFDTRYFMYMEDADICRRMRRNGYEVLVDCTTYVTHNAQRASGKSLRHLLWHIRSAIRFLVGV